jgi:ComF family protein
MKSSLSLKEWFLNLLFPRSCLGCQREGSYLCQDCLATLEISEYQYCLCKKPKRLALAGKCRSCYQKKLNGLYFATSYQNKFLQKLIHHFKYDPYVKELSGSLASLIIAHFQLSSKIPQFGQDWILIPVPLSRKKERRRGFNQAKEIAQELSSRLNLPLIDGVLLKFKETPAQVDLEEKARMENPRGAFLVKNSEKIKNKKILLVDDVYTTGATIEECARVLKEAGAKDVWGVAVARG